MSSIKNIIASNPVPHDLAKNIGMNGVNEILEIFWKSYKDLKEDDAVVITSVTEEDDITQEWYQKLVKRWDSRNRATCIVLNKLIPYHQYSDHTLKKRKGSKSPTIDFCFKDWSTVNSYFGAECKNLYSDKPDKISRYIETGINNYISGRYGSQSTEGSIIGYVLSGNIPKLADEISGKLEKDFPIMNLLRMPMVQEPQYKSIHKRSLDKKEIILYHLFFDFT